MTRRTALVLALAAVLVAGAAVGGLVFYGAQPHHDAAHTTQTPSATASSCSLRVVNKGFVNIYGPNGDGYVPAAQGEIHVGYVVENPCGLAAVDCQFAGVLLDGGGKPIPLNSGGGEVSVPVDVGVIAAGQSVGLAGEVGNTGEYDATRAASLTIMMTVGAWKPASDLPVPRTATAQNVAVTARTGDGYVGVTYTVKQGPEPVTRSDATTYVLLTDGTGRIVGAEAAGLDERRPQAAAVWISPGITAPHAQVWIVSDAH